MSDALSTVKSETFTLSNDFIAEISGTFQVLERTIGLIRSAQIEYEYRSELNDLFISVKRFGEEGGLIPLNSLVIPTKENALLDIEDKISDILVEIINTELTGDESIGASGCIYFERQDNIVSVHWNNDDIFENCKQDPEISLSKETWEQAQPLLKELEVASIAISYRGFGDSMDGVEYTFADKKGNIVIEPVSSALGKLAELFNSLISGPIEGFWNNEGGFGEIVLTEIWETSFFEHRNNFEDSQSSTTDFEIISKLPEKVKGKENIEAVSNPVWG